MRELLSIGRAPGAIVCWGWDSNGEVSDAPAGIFTSVSAGGYHSCALDAAGAISCWGWDVTGQVSGTPAGAYVSVSAGGGHHLLGRE